MSNAVKQPLPASLKPKMKVWFGDLNGEGIGEGRCRLLASIAEKGSLRAAATSLGISYRKAWGDVRKAEALLGFPILIRERGGPEGGATTLTKEGRALLAAFERFRANMELSLQEEFAVFFERTNQ